MADNTKQIRAIIPQLINENGERDEGKISDLNDLIKRHDQESLELNGANIKNAEATIFADSLKGNQTLKSIDLRGNQIGDEGVKSLSAALKENNTLEQIDLRANLVKNEGAKSLADALKKNKTLRSVGLRANLIGDEGAQALSEALQDNQVLQGLNLVSNDDIAYGTKIIIKDKLYRNQQLASKGPEERTDIIKRAIDKSKDLPSLPNDVVSNIEEYTNPLDTHKNVSYVAGPKERTPPSKRHRFDGGAGMDRSFADRLNNEEQGKQR